MRFWLALTQKIAPIGTGEPKGEYVILENPFPPLRKAVKNRINV